MEENKKKVPFMTTVAVMCIFAISMGLGGITPIMAKLYEAYPDIPTATVTYVSSIASLVSIPGSILVGIVAGRKLRIKPTLIILVVLFVAGGCAPTFVPGFPALLITRGIFGFGMGGLSVIGNPLVTGLYPEDKRAGILGISTFVSFGGSMVFQYVAAFLADMNWTYAFMTHALAVIPLIMVIFFLPDTGKQEVQSQKNGYKVPPRAVAMAVIFALMGLMVTPLLFMSSVLAGTISDSAMVAASVSMFYSIGCLIGGAVFGVMYKVLGKHCFGVSAILVSVGIFGAVQSGNLILLYLSMLVAGIGYCSAMPAAMLIIGLVTPQDSVAFATSIMMAVMNAASFLASPWIGLIENITGNAVQMPLYIGAAGSLAIGIILLLINPFPNNTK
jgi:MFS family permease